MLGLASDKESFFLPLLKLTLRPVSSAPDGLKIQFCLQAQLPHLIQKTPSEPTSLEDAPSRY
jgi:hypothetical protein